MGKVYGIHEIELHPGVDEKSLVKFFNQEFAKVYADAGWKMMLLKGDRGQRAGKYAVLFEIKSREERDRWTPAHNVDSEESKRWFAEHKEQVDNLMKKWASFSPTDVGAHLEYTDYLVLD
jgi:hypothetical protein